MKDDEKRARYDQFGHMGVENDTAGYQQGNVDINEILRHFSDIFGEAGGFGGFGGGGFGGGFGGYEPDNSGSDIAMDSSDVILMSNDLESIVKLINISKETIRNIKQNLFWAFFYNVLMIPIAMGILKPIGISIDPMIASLAMVLSSITVILNALRLKK